MKPLTIFCLACLAATIQASDKSVPPQGCVLTSEDYAVYSAVLLDRLGLGHPEAKADFVITKVTSGWDANSHLWSVPPRSNEPWDDTVERFNSRQKCSSQLEPKLEPAISYRLVSAEELGEIFKKGAGGWPDFYQKYSNSWGIWSFSPVGYNAPGSEALVYVARRCGGLCGAGYLVLLTKEDAHWVVKNRLMLWVS